MIKLLMTSVGSLEAQNLLDVIEFRGDADLCVVGTTSIPAIPLRGCERVYLVPPTEGPPSAFCQRLGAIIEREQPDVVIPSRDHDVTILAELAEQFPHLARRVPCGTAHTARLLEDKWLSYLFARDHGLSFAESVLVDSRSSSQDICEWARQVGFPLIAKPRSGSGSRRVLFLSTPEQLQATLTEHDILLQRYIGPGALLETFLSNARQHGQPLFYSLEQSKYSIQTYIDRDGSVEPLCLTLNRMEGGLSKSVERTENERLRIVGEDWALALAEAGWRGPLNIQCQQDTDNSFVVFELNGRFTGATAARYCLGHDELAYLLWDRLGLASMQPRAMGNQPVKYYRTLGVSAADMEALRHDHVWNRPRPDPRNRVTTVATPPLSAPSTA